MGKSVRSKVKRKWRTLKREHVYELTGRQDLEDVSQKLHCSLNGDKYRTATSKNAFKHPKDPEAVFP